MLPLLIILTVACEEDYISAITSEDAKSEADKAAAGVFEWLKSVGISEKLGDVDFKKEDIPKLVQLAFEPPDSQVS